MFRKMMRAKIHRATVTFCDPDYVGSITIDADLLRASGIRPNEAVHVLDIDNGARFETYVIRGESGSGVLGINGAAARLVKPGHKVIVVCFGLLTEDDLDDHVAKVVLVDENNRLTRELAYDSNLDPEPAHPHPRK
ncbi:MAG: aspartate 1-decarboxylase [Phycisphaeraceae bacterium]|nr:aspartate 1-decarboxylase [Phycisphaeraceae bacterium]